MKETLILRKMSKNDLEETLSWRNDKFTRKVSLNSKKINIENHRKWFERINIKTGNLILICYQNKEKVGIVRYEKSKSNAYFVSININPKFRGKGIGEKLLKLSQNKKSIKNSFSKLYARIKKKNIRSIKIFSEAGYNLARECNNYYLFCNTNIHDKVSK